MNLKTKVAGETGEMVEPVPGDVQILLTSKEDPVSMRSLGVSEFSLFVETKLGLERSNENESSQL